jgi:hypothetical protein
MNMISFWLGPWCLTPLPTIYQLYYGGQWRKPEYPDKTTDLSPVTDKLYLIMNHIHRSIAFFKFKI